MVPNRSLLRQAATTVAPIAAAQAALRQVGLDAVAGLTARTLSHGQQRALEIAIALAGQPSVLLLDEPLAGMGAEDGAPIAALMRDLAREHAVLLVEHDMDVVADLADKIAVLVQGRIIAFGPPRAVRADPAVQAAYLGVAV